MAGHTPEPWKAQGRFVTAALPECPDYDPLIVADCRVETNEGEANARLIAAAPDLLKLGEHNLNCYKALRAQVGLTNDLADIREMEAVIAKAKGG